MVNLSKQCFGNTVLKHFPKLDMVVKFNVYGDDENKTLDI